MVHAINDEARQFYEHFDFDPSPVNPFQLLLLMKGHPEGDSINPAPVHRRAGPHFPLDNRYCAAHTV